MARKMDKFHNDYREIKSIDDKIAKLNKQFRALKTERDPIDNRIVKAMQKSTEGTIDGQIVFKIKTSERNTATIGRVMEFAPDVADKIIQKTSSSKIEVL